MRTPIRVLVLAGLVAAPAGVAVIPAMAAKSTSATKATCKAVPKSGGTSYIVRGTLVANATAGAILITPTGGNAAGRKVVGTLGAYDTGVTIRIASCSKVARILANGRERKQTWAGLKAGDKVMVSWKAKKGATLAKLGAAQRVVELRRTK